MDTELESTILDIVSKEPNGVTTERICRFTRKTPQELGDIFERLLAQTKLLGFAGLWMSQQNYEEGKGRIVAALKELHEANPTEADISPLRAAKAAELKWDGKPLERIITKLAAEGVIGVSLRGISLKDFTLELTPRQTSLMERVIEVIEAEAVSPPNPHTIAQTLGIPRQAVEEILRLGLRSGAVLQVSDVVFYTPLQIENLKKQLIAATNNQPFTSNDLRDTLKTTRKYVLPLLDYFDEIGFTVKRGTHRVIL